MNNAVLPEFLEEHTVSSMAVGEIGYIPPWAMWVDRARRCWLNPDFKVHDMEGGMVTMRVERVPEGFRVRVRGDHRWILQHHPPHNGGSESDYLPVVDLRT